MTDRTCENCAEYTADGLCLEHAEPLDGSEWCTGWKESTTNIGLGGTIKTGVIKDGATALGLDKPRELNYGERMNNQTLRACINCKYSKIYDDSYNTLILHCQKRQRDTAFCNVCDDWHKDWLDKEE